MPLRPNVKISQLPTDSLLTGTELLTGIGGDNQNISVQQIADFIIEQTGGSSVTYLLTEDGDELTTEDGDSIIL